MKDQMNLNKKNTYPTLKKQQRKRRHKTIHGTLVCKDFNQKKKQGEKKTENQSTHHFFEKGKRKSLLDICKNAIKVMSYYI